MVQEEARKCTLCSGKKGFEDYLSQSLEGGWRDCPRCKGTGEEPNETKGQEQVLAATMPDPMTREQIEAKLERAERDHCNHFYIDSMLREREMLARDLLVARERIERLEAFRDACQTEAKHHINQMAYLDETECDCAMCSALAELDREGTNEGSNADKGSARKVGSK